MSEVLSIGEIARRAGVSVRTLRFYEQKGLIRAVRAGNGRRHFPRAQMLRLQEILVLKSIGLSLEEIAELMARGEVDAERFLDMQLAALSEQRRRLDILLDQLKAARAAVGGGDELDIATLCNLITSTGRLKMEQDWKDIVEQYYTKEQLAELAKRAPTPEEQEDISAKWANLRARVAKLAEEGADPAGPEAQACAREWKGLIEAFTGGDPGIARSLQRMYADRENWPRQPEPPAPDKVNAFVGQMLAALKKVP